MNVYEVLTTKRRGGELSADALRWFIERFTAGEIADYQMTAFLMAVTINGMLPGEIAALTAAMLDSGEQWRLRDEFEFVADKHSTGGVGDKVSLCLTPWVASCGVNVAMLSGRGLGHTGGTLDKLDSIPGFKARLTRDEVVRIVRETGCVIATSTGGIAPADRRMYSLRDVTATVESLPLITASIMSKKLAMGASALLLDVKFGNGAFMKTEADAVALARSLMAAAEGSGTRVEALITSMEKPLGHAIGNANEVIEAIDMLRTRHPHDLYEVTRAEAVRMLLLSGKYDETAALLALENAIDSGAAVSKAREWIEAQGGDASFIDDPSLLAQPRRSIEVTSPAAGIIQEIDSFGLGMFAVELGAGRLKQEDEVDFAPGLLLHHTVGESVARDEPIATIQLGLRDFPNDELIARFRSNVRIGDDERQPLPLVTQLLTRGDL